ncbi:MAG: phenylalanine--tRNA ligase subunit alpha [Bacteroidetes bacterium]|nr:phenylalanine--tRNA ligase subunit alpha [Bacteroidota bacterium]
MLDKIKNAKNEFNNYIKQVKDKNTLEELRLKFLVKKGTIQQLLDELKNVPVEQKPLFGKELNLFRKYAEETFENLKVQFADKQEVNKIDITLAGRTGYKGAFHPVRQIFSEMISIFTDMGFEVAEGPQIEDEFHNFDALNFQSDHPARDMQDTFFIKSYRDDNKLLLRTHTSPVQIRIMQTKPPPIRCIMPGRVYRNEAISARSLAEFHQIEGLYVDRSVSFAELKATMIVFAKKMYGANSEFRFRPSYFPFTEPSAEIDISCFLCKGAGCKICKGTGWLEIAGCGIVHPNVLNNCGIDSEEYSGYAFGFGIERVALLRTGITDIRYFYENDVRILQQF